MSSSATLQSSSSSMIDRPSSPAAQPLNAPNEKEESERTYQPKSLKFWSVIIGMYLAIFLVALDRTIIATAIPKITDEFDSIQDIGWYGSAYMLTCAIFNPISGRVYQLYSTKWTFLGSIVVFEIGSALCGAAPSSTAFIIGRAIAGIGAAGIFSGGMMVIISLVPLAKRPIFTSFFGMAFAISSVIGPVLGGSFADKVTWRWCFYLNLPIGGFTLLAVALFLNVESPERQQLSVLEQVKRLDPLGIVLLTPSMICLILALQWGGTTDSWSSPKIIGLLVTFAVLFVLFIVGEVMTPETAMAPTRVILNRSVAGGMLFMLLLSGGMMCIVYYLAIWFQAAKGDSAVDAGVSTIPLVLSLTVSSVLFAVLTQKIGYYVPPMLIAPVLCAVGAGLLSTLVPGSGQAQWIGFQVLYGLGIGAGFQTSNLAAQTVLPRADVPLGMALMFFCQQLGGSVFLAVGQNIFSARLVEALSGAVAGLDAAAIVNTGATDLRNVVPAAELDAVVGAYSDAITRVFVLGAALSACMILGAAAMEWRSIKEKKGPSDVEGAKQEQGKSEA